MLRDTKGDRVFNAVHWGFQHQEHGDVFSDLPPAMKTSFLVLRKHVCDVKGWVEYCNNIKPEKWVRRDNDGEVRRHRSFTSCKPIECEVATAGNPEAATNRTARDAEASTG